MMASLGRALTRRILDRPVFVVGAARSGTSVMLQGLGCHTAILSADVESPFLPYLGFLVHPFALRENRRYHQESLQIPLDYAFAMFRRLSFESVFGRDYGVRRMVRRPERLMHLATRWRRWCAKTFPNAVEAQSLAALFPQGKFVYIFRNGVDVVHSRSNFRGMRAIPFDEQCRVWARHVEKFDYLLEMPQAIAVRHEALVENPETVFREVLRHIGEPEQAGPAAFARGTLVHSLGQRTQVGVDALQALRDRPKAHETWGRDEREACARICGPSMARLGYDVPF
jgi:hypothetical protein